MLSVCAYMCVCMCLYVCECVYAWAACPFVYNGCVCWAEEERRIWTRLLKPGSSGGHNRSRLTQRTGLQQVVRRGGGVGGPCEPSKPHRELKHGDKHRISTYGSSFMSHSYKLTSFFSLERFLIAKHLYLEVDASSIHFSACNHLSTLMWVIVRYVVKSLWRELDQVWTGYNFEIIHFVH